MNYCCRKKMAGAAGFEPTHGRIKTCCLTAWLRPCILSGCFGLHPSYVALLSKACNGEVLHPLATKACRVAGNRARTLSASRSFGKAPNKQLPVPVILASQNLFSTINVLRISGSRAVTTGRQSFRPPCSRKAANVIGVVSRVNLSSENISAVLTWQGGTTTRYQGSSTSTGVSCSPTPSAQAARPRTNTGTSAPSSRPRAASRSSPRSVCHRWSRPTRVVAAPELPPPNPPPVGRRVSRTQSAPRGAKKQVVLGGNAGQFGQQADLPVFPGGEMQGVAMIEKLEQGLQQVIAVRPASGDVQEQVQLGWCRQAQGCPIHGRRRGSQRVITRVSSMSWPDSCRRWGNCTPSTS